MRGRRSRKPIGFRQWVVHKAVPEKTEVKEKETISGEEVAVTRETMPGTKEFMAKEETLTVSGDRGTKEKELVSGSNQTTDTNSNSNLSTKYNTTSETKSQVQESLSFPIF